MIDIQSIALYGSTLFGYIFGWLMCKHYLTKDHHYYCPYCGKYHTILPSKKIEDI